MQPGPFLCVLQLQSKVAERFRNSAVRQRLAGYSFQPTRSTVTITTDERLQATAQIARHPLHPMLVPVPIVCFIGALLTDITYCVSQEIMWADFSAWLLVVGVTVGVLAACAGLIDFLSSRSIRATPPAWPHMLGNV